ncbi:Arsenate reductase, glutaredoxin family [Catalinimonas alkaloidigena]|uniref:Arsenate reductase, glutaredoxin family n=1 Tax=Catalinimonas alkaloidigena TaxID=1075417 RepID=A0A1G9H1R3_9BACT|nr:hypothetical protein [Catalinimonas alkaloidigena]SDL06886.1 Arsenate reductase, glutaredoxin family [Catalinimonas alkaloidigena]
MEKDEKTLKIYHYPDESQVIPKILPYAHIISNHVQEIDVRKQPVTETQIAELMSMLPSGTSVRDIINDKSDLYKEKYAESDLSDDEWIKVLAHTPELWSIIAVRGNRAVLVRYENDIEQLNENRP